MSAAKKAPAKPQKKRKVVERTAGKIDWVAVKRRFVTGALPVGITSVSERPTPSQSEVAQEFGISLRGVERHCAEEDWTAQREAFQREVRILEDKQLAQGLADRRVRSQVAYAATSERGRAKIDLSLRRQGEMPAETVQKLMGALRTSQQVTEVAMGKSADGDTQVNVDWTIFITPPPAALPAVVTIDVEANEIGGVVSTRRGS